MRDHIGTTALVVLTADLTQIRDDADCLIDVINGLHNFRELVEGHGRRLDIDVLGHGLTARLHVALDFTPAPDASGDWPPASSAGVMAAEPVETTVLSEIGSDEPAAPDDCIPADDIGALGPAEIAAFNAAPGPAAEPAQPEPAGNMADEPDRIEAATPDLVPLIGARCVRTSEPDDAAPQDAGPAPAEPAAPFDPALIRTGPYAGRYPASHPMTDAEELRALELHAAGVTAGEIARALNRDPRGFYHQLNALLAEIADADDSADPAPASQTAPSNPIDDLSAADRRVLDRIVALGFPTVRGVTWSAGMDFDIVQGLSEGHKTAQIAADLGVDAAVVKARYHQLVPTTGVEVQATVLRVLRARANAGGPDA